MHQRLALFELFAREALDFHDLKDHNLRYMKRVRSEARLGQYVKKRKTIELAPGHTENSRLSNVVQTVLHEIAHAKADGPALRSHMHDYVWRRHAEAVGVKTLNGWYKGVSALAWRPPQG
jgi:predicted SprT family Zn-dependent metalloprotease